MGYQITRIDLSGVNCYLVKVEEAFILFDTGGHMLMDKVFDDKRASLDKALQEAGCKPGNLKLVVLTHGDNDHTANAAFIREKYKAKIAMHQGDLELVEKLEIEKLMESFKYDKLSLKISFFFLKSLIRKVSIKILSTYEKFSPDILLGEGDNLKEYGLDASILHIPGHTPGSIGVLLPEGDFIAGDVFANGKKPSIAPNACDFVKLKESVARLKALDLKKVYPGHGSPFIASEI